MKIVSNERLIRRNARIAQFTGLGGMAVLLVGVYFFVTRPEEFVIIWGIVLLGFILSQVGIYFTNRWGRRPRPDEVLNVSLKGLDHNYSLYHYITAVPHLLVGPAGVWVIMPRHQKGRITYEKGRWRQRGGGFFLAYMRLFGQESIGRLDLEVASEVDSTRNYLSKKLPDQEIPPIQAALVFTTESAQLEADDAPVPTIHPRKLKELIRKTSKTKPITLDRVKEIQAAIEADMPSGEKKEVEEADKPNKKEAIQKK
jgi:hypothetical protein